MQNVGRLWKVFFFFTWLVLHSFDIFMPYPNCFAKYVTVQLIIKIKMWMNDLLDVSFLDVLSCCLFFLFRSRIQKVPWNLQWGWGEVGINPWDFTGRTWSKIKGTCWLVMRLFSWARMKYTLTFPMQIRFQGFKDAYSSIFSLSKAKKTTPLLDFLKNKQVSKFKSALFHWAGVLFQALPHLAYFFFSPLLENQGGKEGREKEEGAGAQTVARWGAA